MAAFKHCGDCSGSTGPTCRAQNKCVGRPPAPKQDKVAKVLLQRKLMRKAR